MCIGRMFVFVCVCVCFYILESTVKGGMQHVLNPLNSVDSPAWYEKHRWSGTDPALCQRSVSIRKAVNIGGVRVCGADSRHGHVAAIYYYVSKFLTSWLIWQFQCVGCPQRLMETCQTSHWRCWGVICRRNPHSDPMKTCVADGLIWRGWGPGDGLSWLRRPIKKNVIVNNRRRWFMTITQWHPPNSCPGLGTLNVSCFTVKLSSSTSMWKLTSRWYLHLGSKPMRWCWQSATEACCAALSHSQFSLILPKFEFRPSTGSPSARRCCLPAPDSLSGSLTGSPGLRLSSTGTSCYPLFWYSLGWHHRYRQW